MVFIGANDNPSGISISSVESSIANLGAPIFCIVTDTLKNSFNQLTLCGTVILIILGGSDSDTDGITSILLDVPEPLPCEGPTSNPPGLKYELPAPPTTPPLPLQYTGNGVSKNSSLIEKLNTC